MFKKTLSLVTLVAFLLFEWACLSVNKVPVTSVTDKDDIVGVTKISGEDIQIPKENPARVVGDRIILRPRIIHEISLSDVSDFKQNDKGIVYEFTTKEGRTIRNIEGKKTVSKIVFPWLKYEPVPIPLSEVNFVSVLSVNAGKTIGFVLGALGASIGMFYLLLSNLSFRIRI